MMIAFGLQKPVDEIEIKSNKIEDINGKERLVQRKKKHKKISDMLM